MNIIDAISHIVSEKEWKIGNQSNESNRANSMGEALEEYIKNAFAGTLNSPNENYRLKKLNEYFSYLGNQNNPPDMMLKFGDAIEVKKIESNNSSLALNSSYPKAKLFADSTLITSDCRNAEKWTEKDIIYAVGVVKNRMLSSLCMVYGMDYAANGEIYERIRDAIRSGVLTIPDIEFSTTTKELGRVNKVDPLGITYLRVRGMWAIESPFKVFNYIYSRDERYSFNFMALINEEKYFSFDNVDKMEWLEKEVENFKINEVMIKDPNNPAKLKKAKLITFKK